MLVVASFKLTDLRYFGGKKLLLELFILEAYFSINDNLDEF